MSYLKTKTNAITPYAMGDFACWVPLVNLFSCPGQPNQAGLDKCTQQADDQVAPLDAQWYDLAQNWHPTGVYDSATIRSLVTQHQNLMAQARGALDAAEQNAPNTLTSTIDGARWQLDQVSVKASALLKAADDADAQGIDQIQCDDLRGWVIDSMVWSSNALHAATDVTCQKDTFSFMISWATAVMGAGSAFYDGAKAVVGLAIDAAKKVLKVGFGLLDLVAWLETYGPWVGAGLAAWWIFLREKKGHKKRAKGFLSP